MGGQRKKSPLPADAPWLILPTEDESQWRAFQHYLTMEPPRSVRRTIDERSKSSRGTVYAWSTQHRWVERAKAYDAWMARQEMEAFSDERLRIRRDQLRLAERVRQLAERRMNELHRLETLTRVTPKDALAMMQAAVQVERLLLGEATERTETATWDLSSLSKEQIDKLEDIYRKASGGE